MRCENIPPLITLADEGELGRLTTWRLRRHLATCPACSAERAEFRWLDNQLRTNDPAGRLAVAPEKRPVRRTAPSVRRRVLLTVGTTFGLGALGTVATLAPSYITFAQVQQAMAAVQTAEWTQSESWLTQDSQKRVLVKMSSSRLHVRMEPPAVLLETRGRENQLTSITRSTSESYRLYRIPLHEVQFVPHADEADIVARLHGEIQRLFTFMPPMMPRGIPWKVCTVRLEGKPALQFTFLSRADSEKRFEFTLWADPTTKRVLRAVQEEKNLSTGQVTRRMVSENIRCDMPIPETVFTLKVPAGTPVYHVNIQWERRSTASLTAKESNEVKRLIDETYAGVLASDWKRASAGWDLNYAPSLSGSPVPRGGVEQWLRRKVATGRQYQVMRCVDICAVNEAPYTRVLGFGDAMVPPGERPLLAVSITPDILYQDGDKEGYTEIFYFKRGTAGDLRIVGWQYPDKYREQERQEWLETRKRRTK
ncbi:MAG: zf-HC2 domain-containing protein [Armatimonas sp.]